MMEEKHILRTEIKKEILNQNANFAEFSRRSGVNRGVFSLILNPSSPKPISLNQLETIGKALNKESGWLFELYVEECFFNGKPNRRRVEPFLMRCAELGRTDCIHQVLWRLKEDPKYVDMVFEISEALYLSGKTKDTLNFYEFVALNATGIHAEKLAISHYRIFRASIGEEHEKNLRTLLRFEPYCDDLPIHYQLDALMKLVDLHFSLIELENGGEKWIHTERCSKKLFLLADQVYESIKAQRKAGKTPPSLPLEKPLVVYYGYSLLSLGNVMLSRENFTHAYVYLSVYEDLSWFEELDEQGKIQVERFAMFGRMNWGNFGVLEGKAEAVQTCVDFAKEHPEDMLIILINLLTAANMHGFDIKDALEMFLDKIEKDGLASISTTNGIVRNRYYMELYYQKSLYHLGENDHKEALIAIKKAVQIADEISCLDNKKFHNLLFELMEKHITALRSN